MPKLCTLVVYYPDKIPSPAGGFPPSINVLAHIAGSQGMAPKFPSYSYPNVEVGFAETDLEPYDRISATLAWTRTLTAVRKGLRIEVDLEKAWEKHLERKLLILFSCIVLFLTPFIESSEIRCKRCRVNHGHYGR